MINNNIKIYCNDEPVLTLCNIYDNNTPVSIEKLTSLAEFETMHNAKADAHKNIIDNIQAKLLNKAEKAEIPTKISELENDNNYITKEESSQQNANIDLSNLSEEGLNLIQANSGGGLEIGDIGIAPLGIDETLGKRRYLNGQVIIQEQYQVFTDKVKSAIVLYPTLACTEEDWQATATLSAFGQCGKFVVDDEAGTIRLPKITGFIQGLNDLASLGSLAEAGLPNISGTLKNHPVGNSDVYGYSGSFTLGDSYTPSYYNGVYNTAQGNVKDLSLDASLSNSIYGNSDTVQPESIRYPYFIQVATGAEVEDNIINEIELNNPFSLLDYKYSEYELNNLSWLRSNRQYNSKAVYPAVYDLLLKIYNGTEIKDGVSVKLSTEAFTDYDFVLNTSEETFMLPIKVKANYFENIAPVVGNGMTLGLYSNNNTGGLGMNGNAYAAILKEAYGKPSGTTKTGNAAAADVSFGVTSDPTKSGIEAHLTEKTDLYLYFYVGETVQNANLINAGRIEEKLTEALAKPHIVETYQNGTSWYRVYSDGWCEQGGRITTSTNTSGDSIYFLKAFKDTNYTFTASILLDNISNTWSYTIVAGSKTTTSCNVYCGQTNTSGARSNPVDWYACGYIA